MSPIHHITDLRCPELDVFCRMNEAQRKHHQHRQQGLFIAEGIKVTEIALSSGKKPISFLIEERHIEGKAARFLSAYPNVPVYTANETLLSELTGYAFTRGFLCAMERGNENTTAQILSTASRLAILEDIADPSNLGSIFRNAAALGLDGLLLSPSCCDPFYRKAVRTSMGTVFQIPWARIDAGWPEDVFRLLHENGFVSYAMALDTNALPLDKLPTHTEKKIAIVLGNEGKGLHRETIAACSHTVYIPMYKGVDSLNVASASAVAFWEIFRK